MKIESAEAAINREASRKLAPLEDPGNRDANLATAREALQADRQELANWIASAAGEVAN